MAESTDKVDLKVRLKIRKDTASNWASANPTLLDGEIGIEVDPSITATENSTSYRIKIGDGVTTWNNLKYSLNTVDLNKTLNELDSNNVKLNPTTASQTISKDVIIKGKVTVGNAVTLEYDETNKCLNFNF